LQRTRQHVGKNRSGQPFSKTRGVALAALRQRQIGKSCMLTRDAPGSLPVARQINYRNNFARHGRSIDKAIARSSRLYVRRGLGCAALLLWLCGRFATSEQSLNYIKRHWIKKV